MKTLATLLFKLGCSVFICGFLVMAFLRMFPPEGIKQAIDSAKYLTEITQIGLSCIVLAGIIRVGGLISNRF